MLYLISNLTIFSFTMSPRNDRNKRNRNNNIGHMCIANTNDAVIEICQVSSPLQFSNIKRMSLKFLHIPNNVEGPYSGIKFRQNR